MSELRSAVGGRRGASRIVLLAAVPLLAAAGVPAGLTAPEADAPARVESSAASEASAAPAVAAASPALAAPATTAPAPAPRRPLRAGENRPNIVLITSDDQNVGDLRYMPKTRSLFAETGVEVSGFISPHPLCCPARAEILTGEYAQNNGVRHNRGPYGGYAAYARKRANMSGNIGAWLKRAGYRTAMVGKMLNGYTKSSPRPRGWDHWNPTTTGTYAYVGTTFENDGRPHRTGRYVADAVTRYTNSYIREFTAATKPRRPFFIWASHVGPHHAIPVRPGHAGPVPARRHAGLLAGAVNPAASSPSYLEVDRSDKPTEVQTSYAGDAADLDRLAQLRGETVMSLDDSVASIIDRLDDAGVLDNTIVVYTSDNGFLMGEHDLLTKNFAYEEVLRVPFLVRGPGLPGGSVSTAPITTVDLASTFLARARVLAEVRAAGRTDGIDFWPILKGRQQANPTQLIQAGADDPAALAALGWWWRGVRTGRYTYAGWHSGQEELYDNLVDPHQLTSVHDDPRYAAVLAELRARTAALVGCDGSQECKKQDFGPEPLPSPAAAALADP